MQQFAPVYAWPSGWHLHPLRRTSLAAVQSSSQVNTNPVIAAVPLMVLTLITLLVGTYTWSQRSM